MAEAQEQPVDRIIEIERLAIYAPALEGESRSPRLAWCSYRGNPRLTVFTNTKSDPVANGVISAPMDPRTFFIFLAKLEEFANGGPGQKDKVTCKTSSRDDNGNSSSTGEKVLLSEVVFGKDEQGIVWVSVIAKDRPRIKFEFHLSDYHEIYHGDGSPFSKGDASSAQALSHIDLAKRIYPVLIKEYNDLKAANANTSTYTARSQQKPAPYQAKKAEIAFDDDVF